MKYFFTLLRRFYRFVQSGFYLDFLFKKISEVVVRNLYVYSAQFFGEKFIIEVCTKLFAYLFMFYFIVLYIRSLGFKGFILTIFLVVVIIITIINLIFLFDIFFRLLKFAIYFNFH